MSPDKSGLVEPKWGISPEYSGLVEPKWGISSVGRALAWHARGQRFEPAILHKASLLMTGFYFYVLCIYNLF